MPNARYVQLPAEKEPNTVTDLSDAEASQIRMSANDRSWRILHWTLHILESVIIVLLALFITVNPQRFSSSSCWRQYHYWSPVDQVAEASELVHTQYNSSSYYDSPYKGPPTPLVEQAWTRLIQNRLLNLSTAEMSRTQWPLTSAKFPVSIGGGYPVGVLGNHHLHCLHYIWKDHHSEYYTSVPAAKQKTPELYERHYEHCVDFIRQALICNFDTSVTAFNWVDGFDKPMSNANVVRKCVDFNRIDDWIGERRPNIDEAFVWERDEDTIALDYIP